MRHVHDGICMGSHESSLRAIDPLLIRAPIQIQIQIQIQMGKESGLGFFVERASVGEIKRIRKSIHQRCPWSCTQ